MGEGRQFTQVAEALGIVERGDFQADASTAMQALLQKLGDIAGAKGKAKGEMTITLTFEVEGRSVGVSGDFKVKAPKEKRGRSFFFMTAQGGLSQEPQGDDLFTGPREVRAPQTA